MTTSTILAPSDRRLHRALIDGAVVTGNFPAIQDLANLLELSADDVRNGLERLAAVDYLALDAQGAVSCLYPFSAVPTPHIVRIDDHARFAMCAIDAIGIPAMLGQELDIAGQCAICHAPIALRVRPGSIIAASPANAMIVARRDESEPAFAACCPFTVFVCSEQHATLFTQQTTGAVELPLSKALSLAESIFAGMLAAELPTRRPRGMRWGEGAGA